MTITLNQAENGNIVTGNYTVTANDNSFQPYSYDVNGSFENGRFQLYQSDGADRVLLFGTLQGTKLVGQMKWDGPDYKPFGSFKLGLLR